MSEDSAPHPADGHHRTSGKHDHERPPWVTKALRLVIGTVVSLLIAGTVTGIESLTHKDTRDHLYGVELSLAHHLAVSQPVALSKDFYRRLGATHGFGVYQWNAPFNADIARANVVHRFGGNVSALTNTGQLPPWLAADQPVPPQPISTTPTAADARAARAYNAAMTRIDNTSVPRLSDALKPSNGGAMVTGVVYNIVLGLPDAYLNTIRVLLPHAALFVRIGIVAVVFLLAVMLAKGDIRGALVLMFLSPFIASLVGGLLIVGADIVTHIVTALLPGRRGPISTPASFWTTISALGTAFTAWAYPKAAEHHLTEAVMRRLPKSLVGEE